MEISSSLKFSLDADMDVEKCENAAAESNLSLDFIFPTSKQKEMSKLSKDKGTFLVSL